MGGLDNVKPGPVVTLGEIMALFLAEAGRPLETATTFELGVAGAEATVAIGLCRLGQRAAYIGRLGDDALGRQILRQLRGEGVDVSHLRLVPEKPTGVLIRDAPTDRPISVEYRRAASAASELSEHDIPEQLIRSAELLHVTAITAVLSPTAQQALMRAIHCARESGVPVSFDPNVRLKLAPEATWRRIIETITPLCDIVLTGLADARVVTDGDPMKWFLERGAGLVVVKDGANGALETDGVHTTRQAAHPVTAADPVGAGDAFAAGWLSAWLRGTDAQTRLREAVTVAALCVGVRGDLPGLPTARTLHNVVAAAHDVDR